MLAGASSDEQTETPRSKPGLDWSFVIRGAVSGIVAILVIKAGIERVLLVAPNLGIDARIYINATSAWMAGADPWTAGALGDRFNAPPPSLLPIAPFALLPDPLGIALLVGLSAGALVWIVRRLRLPWYWLGFAPALDAVWGGNPNVIVVALLVGGVDWLATLFKIYAVVPLVIWREWRRLAITVGFLLTTVLIAPWGTFVGEYPMIAAGLTSQSGGGLSATGWLILPTVIALLSLPRREAGWLAIPALWPAAQFHYATFMMPVGHPILALMMPIAEAGRPAVAVILYAVWRWAWPALTCRLQRHAGP